MCFDAGRFYGNGMMFVKRGIYFIEKGNPALLFCNACNTKTI